MKIFAPAILAALLALGATAPAFADDEMLGTFDGSRMKRMDERSIRVPDSEMDREEMLIDRQERKQATEAVKPTDESVKPVQQNITVAPRR